MSSALSVVLCFKDKQFRDRLEQWLEGVNVVRSLRRAPFVLVPSLRLGFVVLSLHRGQDVVGEVLDWLDRLPSDWERHVVLYGGWGGRDTAEVYDRFPALSVAVQDSGAVFSVFRTLSGAAEYVARVVLWRCGRA